MTWETDLVEELTISWEDSKNLLDQAKEELLVQGTPEDRKEDVFEKAKALNAVQPKPITNIDEIQRATVTATVPVSVDKPGHEVDGYGDDGHDDQQTADGFDDEESAEIEIMEYVDIIDEGYFTPNVYLLIAMACFVLLAAAGIGTSVYYIWESSNESPSTPKPPTTRPPSPPPTTAPSASPSANPSLAPSLPVFVCDICRDGGPISLPDGVLSIVGQPNRTCAELVISAEAGIINSQQCPVLQSLTQDPCGCNEGGDLAPPSCTMCANDTHIVRDPTGMVDVSGLDLPGSITTVLCSTLETIVAAGTFEVSECQAIHELTVATCDCGPPPPAATCRICVNGDIRDPVGQVELTTSDVVSCELLETLGQTGNISPEECPVVQGLAAEPCDCGVTDEDALILQLLAEVVGNNIYLPGTPHFAASRYLLYDDPRHSEFTSRRRRRRRHRELQPLNQTEESDPEDDGAMEFPVIMLTDLTEEEVIQRFLMILLYYQSTENRAIAWTTDCAASIIDPLPPGLVGRKLAVVAPCGEGLDGESFFPWLSAASECEWQGVTCSNETDMVLGLGLSGFGLKGRLPTELLALSTLETLDLSSNELEGGIPAAYFSSANASLTGLFLANNSFIGALPTIDIGESALQLQILDVYNNLLTGEIPDSFGNLLINVVTLNLGQNAFTGEIPTAVCEIPTLEELAADCTEVTCECCTSCCVDVDSTCTAVTEI